MPEIGEIRRANEIGKRGADRYIYQACKVCGKERWVMVSKGSPMFLRCLSCVHNDPEYRAKMSRTQLLRVPKGEKAHNWKGGRKSFNSYVMIWLSEEDFFYPMADKAGYVLEHRLVMAKKLGRCLQSWEIVHHKDGVRNHNADDNLEMTSSLGEHIRGHSKGYRDGYTKGLQDGRNKKIQELTAIIEDLKEAQRCQIN